MHITVFGTQPHDREFFTAANAGARHELRFLEARLDVNTAALAAGSDAACIFVNDHADRETLLALRTSGVRLVLLRCAGFNNVDVKAAAELSLRVARVPAYSPYAVAEHTAALVLGLNRRLHKAHARVREGNFSLQGLCGFDLHGRSVGIVGTGKIGAAFAAIMHGFGCVLRAHDPVLNPECERLGVRYVSLSELWSTSDVISLHCPLTPATRHLVDDAAFAAMKPGVMLVNTGRGALLDTRAAIRALKSGQLGHLGIDVYEEEEDLFFQDHSADVIQDDVFTRLLTFPNVMITAHQAFFTREALTAIAETTLANATAFETGTGVLHTVG